MLTYKITRYLRPIMLSLVLPLASCTNSKTTEGKFATRPTKIQGMNADRLMPPESTAIKYKCEDSGFGYAISWECNVTQNDFVNFAEKRGWNLLKKKPGNKNILFHFYGSFEMPEDYYYYFSPTASSAGLWIMYDKAKEILYGQYSDR